MPVDESIYTVLHFEANLLLHFQSPFKISSNVNHFSVSLTLGGGGVGEAQSFAQDDVCEEELCEEQGELKLEPGSLGSPAKLLTARPIDSLCVVPV